MNKLNNDKLIMGMMDRTGASYDQVLHTLQDYCDSDSESESETDYDTDSESDSGTDYDSDGSIDLESMTLEMLKNECVFNDLPTKGSMAQLREQLWAWDDSEVANTEVKVKSVTKPKAKPKAKRVSA